ncbi:MAG: GNAT family N-acetyltransferase [Gammaproteobacteria bacterium]|nr:GNAT family N-acetyltransferase [Gammaproteobacteria bacterium]
MSALYNIKNLINDKVVYEFSNNKEYLEQYSQLVDRYYKLDLDLDLAENNMRAGCDELLTDEYVYIVRENARVVAGARVNFSERSDEAGLPMEEPGFSVLNYLPQDFNHPCYGEIGRLVVDPTYRGKDVLKKMIFELIEFMIRKRCGYLFVLAPVMNSVLYRRICKSLKIPIVIHREAQVPDKALYRRLDIKLLSCDLRALSAVFGHAANSAATVDSESAGLG